MAGGDANDPLPLIKVRVTGASARCTVTGAGHVPDTTLDFSAQVSYWNGASYTALPALTEDGTTAFPDPATLSVDGKPLSTWIESWSVATESAGITRVEAPGVARLEVPAVVSIHTVPLRVRLDANGDQVVGADGAPEADPLSTLSVTVGSIGCTAEDHR